MNGCFFFDAPTSFELLVRQNDDDDDRKTTISREKRCTDKHEDYAHAHIYQMKKKTCTKKMKIHNVGFAE